MQNHRLSLFTHLLVMLVLIAACRSQSENTIFQLEEPLETSVKEPTEVIQKDEDSEIDPEFLPEEFNADNFDNPTEITNQWFPLTPGMQYIFEGQTEEGGVTSEHQVIFTITDLTKVIHETQTVVVWDRDYSEGELVETELAFFAQDNDGNVWRMGEYPEVYENGVLVEAPAWISGYKGAIAGIMMTVNPTLGTPSYSQGWGPAVDFTDRAFVEETGLQICVVMDCFNDVIVIAEYSRAEPNAFQLKYYSPRIGNVKIGYRGDDATREQLELVRIRDLSAEELAEVRKMVLLLEANAYIISKEVYDQTEPVK
ncbi:MAG: hypothetical protein R3356_06225 [Eudoraea sp.]|nr:hypothetical protein [Eudoraea sp.]